MPRVAYFLEVDPMDITYLAWAAGLASGLGNKDQADSFMAMLGRVQALEVPDENETTPTVTEYTPLVEAPAPAEDRTPDPSFMPPPPAPPMNNQDDFGAGPPPGI